MSDLFVIILAIGFFLLTGIIFALPLLLLWRVMMRSRQGRTLAILVFSLASFILMFGLTSIIVAQIPIVFVCTAYDLDACYSYAREAGLENSAEFERLANEELIYRNLIPPFFQKSCHIREPGVCAILDREAWDDQSGSFWLSSLAGLLSGVGTAVTLLFFTRKRPTVGQSQR